VIQPQSSLQDVLNCSVFYTYNIIINTFVYRHKVLTSEAFTSLLILTSMPIVRQMKKSFLQKISTLFICNAYHLTSLNNGKKFQQRCRTPFFISFRLICYSFRRKFCLNRLNDNFRLKVCIPREVSTAKCRRYCRFW